MQRDAGMPNARKKKVRRRDGDAIDMQRRQKDRFFLQESGTEQEIKPEPAAASRSMRRHARNKQSQTRKFRTQAHTQTAHDVRLEGLAFPHPVSRAFLANQTVGTEIKKNSLLGRWLLRQIRVF